ncbi:MAG: Triosephosphate isomerase [Holosporales bacterium]
MTEKIIVANWKMNGNLKLVKEYGALFNDCTPKYRVVVCPSFVHLWSAVGPQYDVGAQDCHYAKSGAHTGSISAPMLQEMGVKYVILGHSERRQNLGETDIIIQKKAKSAVDHGLIPIICIGESLEDREDERAYEVVRDQLTYSIPRGIEHFYIAYEPVWAIGSGKTATPTDITSMHKFIKEIHPSAKVLYGGSVNASNAENIIQLDGVDGLLIGSASQNVEEFKKIIA